MRNARRRHLEHKRKMRGLILYTLGILFFIYLTVSIIISDGGIMRYMKLQSIKRELLAEIDAIKKRNEAIRFEIEDGFKDETKVEELARERGLSRDGELIIKLKDEKGER